MNSFTLCKAQYTCFISAAIIDNSLQLTISAKAVGIASLQACFTVQNYETCTPTPALQLSWSRCRSGSLLLPLTSVFYSSRALVLRLSLATEKTNKDGDFRYFCKGRHGLSSDEKYISFVCKKFPLSHPKIIL